MPPVSEQARAKTAWGTILNQSGTAESHACVIAAQRMVGAQRDPAVLAAQYHRLREQATYASLNRIPMSAGRTAELAAVVRGPATGLNATSINGHHRHHLRSHELIVAYDRRGTRQNRISGLCTLRATLSGVAVMRAEIRKPVRLSADEASPLMVIDSAMRTQPSGGALSWPGNDVSLRIAQLWSLVERVHIPPAASGHWSSGLGMNVFRLTAAGQAALNARIDSHRDVTAATAEVLERVRVAHPSGRVDFRGYPTGGIQRCLDQGWVIHGKMLPGGGRALHLTDPGREALSRFKFRQDQAAAVTRPERKPVTALEPGMWVRLLNRDRYPGLGPHWVRVEEVLNIRDRDPAALPGNYELWVVGEGQPDPFLYPAPAVYRTVRFEIQPT